ncbi:hypothetical protein ABTD45_19675, partial [Acinetobacter baumannii]
MEQSSTILTGSDSFSGILLLSIALTCSETTIAESSFCDFCKSAVKGGGVDRHPPLVSIHPGASKVDISVLREGV